MLLPRGKRRLRQKIKHHPIWVIIKDRIKVESYVSLPSYIFIVTYASSLTVASGVDFTAAANDFISKFLDTYSDLNVFQGTRFYTAMDHSLAARVREVMDSKGSLMVNPHANYKFNKAHPASDDQEVVSTIQETVAEFGYEEEYDKGLRSDHLDDPDLVAAGYLVNFSEESDKPYCEDMEMEYFVYLQSMAAEYGREGTPWEAEVCAPDPVKIAMIPVSSTSTGNFSEVVGNKKENGVHVACSIVAALQSDQPPAFSPTAPSPKLEAIKKGKKGRVIQVTDPAIDKASDACFSSYRMPRGLEFGTAIGVPFNKTFGERLVARLTRTCGEDYLVKHGLHESDKKAWESTTKPNSAIIYICTLLCLARSLVGWMPVAARVLADYYFPLFAAQGNYYGGRPGVVSSGNKFTAAGNTFRHRTFIISFTAFVETHEGRAGSEACSCTQCTYALAHGFELDREVSEFELGVLNDAVLMGDDFLAVWTDASPIYDEYCDIFHGTVTKTDRKPWDEGEFCKRRLMRTETKSGYFYSTTRKLGTVIYKFHGPRAIQRASKAASCKSIAVDCNDKEVYDFCEALYGKLTAFGKDTNEDMELAESWKGTREMREFPSWQLVQALHMPNARDLYLSAMDHESILQTGQPSKLAKHK
uniref:Putative RNA dependent RNA polymerase n=1 Tax=Xiangtouao virus TaxID=2656662 RepID=A0A5P8PP43_9VIRU|nr:MAG: putative RNA dependent RNA polymerase [Xiangtouao virus]